MKFLVLGGGAQGSACAFDLVRREDVEHVILADADASGPKDFLLPFVGGKLERRVVDARDADQVRGVMGDVDAVACALPYYFNLEMTRLAIEAGTHFCDLGGNTKIVDQQKELTDLAKREAVSAVADCCGLTRRREPQAGAVDQVDGVLEELGEVHAHRSHGAVGEHAGEVDQAGADFDAVVDAQALVALGAGRR